MKIDPRPRCALSKWMAVSVWIPALSFLLLSGCSQTPREGRPLSEPADADAEKVTESSQSSQAVPPGSNEIRPLVKSKEEWKKLLSNQEYNVLFEEGTERAGTSPLNQEKREGTFICAACYLPLFESSKKYESGTGWPSFFDVIPGRLGTKQDHKLVYSRTEYHCIRCGGHQGHVFEDGPPPTGLRYCNNGVALRFIPKNETMPELRT
jgi:peptide-methionine (R)-S-oxide reductase